MEQEKEYYERALRIDELAYGSDNAMVAIRANNLGGILQYMGDIEGARKLYNRSYKILRETRGETHPATQLAWTNLDSLVDPI